jgi:hypothetical protein
VRRAAVAGLAVAAVAAAVAGAVAGARDGGGGPAGAPARATVRVDARARGPTVPPSFLGLSVEWDSVWAYARAHRAVARLLAPIARAQGTPPALRIGGDSGDQAWWNPRGRPRPPAVLQDVGPATLGAVGRLARALHGPVALGVDLALGDPANARALATAAARRLPAGRLATLEVGNEPDLFARGRTFRIGRHVHRRLVKDPHYSLARYAADATRYLEALDVPLRAGARAPRLAVGGFAGPAWWPALPGLLARWRGRAGELDAHLYALADCDAATPPAGWLTSPAASAGRVATLRPLLATARRARLPLRVTELNSAACGGRAGLSDTPAAALWLADTLFALLRLGAAGADVHTWDGARYAPFAVRAEPAAARPPLAGMRAFARAAPTGSRLVATHVTGGDRLRAWATAGRRGAVRIALLAPRPAIARVAAGGRTCTGAGRTWRSRDPVLRLRAPSVTVLRCGPPG